MPQNIVANIRPQCFARITFGRFAFIMIASLCLAAFSYWYALHSQTTDFPVYFNSAIFIFKNGGKFADLYSLPMASLYPLPEVTNPAKYNYSPISVIFFAPFILFDYFVAKALFIFASILAYMTAIAILIHLLKFQNSDRRLIFIFSLLWTPFQDDLRNFQINSFLLLLIVASVYLIAEKRTVFPALLIAIASLLKIFPAVLIFIFASRKTFVWLISALLISLALMTPGSTEWIAGVYDRINPLSQNIIYHFYPLQFEYARFIVTAVTFLISTYILLKFKIGNELYIFSLVISNIFLTAQYYQIHNATILIVPTLLIIRQIQNLVLSSLIVLLLTVPFLFEISAAPATHTTSIISILILNALLWAIPFSKHYFKEFRNRSIITQS